MTYSDVGSKSIVLDGFALIPWIRHGFTHKVMGDMGISPETFAEGGLPGRLQEALRDLGMEPSRAVLAHQVHGDNVGVVRAGEKTPGLRAQTDALVCQTPGMSLVTFGADCPNVFLVDTATKAIGLAHSGRLGTLARIVPKTIAAMAEQFGCKPQEMVAAISPSIGPCCYPTDLWSMLAAQLSQCGVGEIHNAALCTACNEAAFYSYRKTKDTCGRMFGALMIAEP